MECGDFITHLEKAYPMVKWSVEQTKINQSIMDMLQLASRNDAPRGVAANSQSRAMYGVDVMLQWKDDEEKEQPTILECNFMPDCTRACQYYPNFADTVFHTLFLDHIDDGQMECGDFITHLEKAYPMVKWSVERTKINQSIMDMLQLASRNDAPRGVAANSQSRAMYGVDVMLQWKDDEEKEQPTILECNFMPDCTRACQYYPNFADTVFHTLFLDHIDDGQVTAL